MLHFPGIDRLRRGTARPSRPLLQWNRSRNVVAALGIQRYESFHNVWRVVRPIVIRRGVRPFDAQCLPRTSTRVLTTPRSARQSMCCRGSRPGESGITSCESTFQARLSAGFFLLGRHQTPHQIAMHPPASCSRSAFHRSEQALLGCVPTLIQAFVVAGAAPQGRHCLRGCGRD